MQVSYYLKAKANDEVGEGTALQRKFNIDLKLRTKSNNEFCCIYSRLRI
jgi:hypothetical protein